MTHPEQVAKAIYEALIGQAGIDLGELDKGGKAQSRL